MASKTAGAAEKMNGGGGKMEDMAVKTDEAAKKLKSIGKKDGGCDGEDGRRGGEDGRCLRQICANFAGRRGKGCATFCASGRCANGLRINCLEWQKTRRWPRFLSKNAV